MFDYDNGLQERIRKDVDCVNKYLTKLSDAEQVSKLYVFFGHFLTFLTNVVSFRK